VAERSWTVVSVDELDRIPLEGGLEWRPIRRRLGIGAFGINAYTAAGVGDLVVEEHTETSGHQEVYVVLRGRARFTLDGEELDAPAGTLVYLPDGAVKRVAVSEEDGTIVLAIGGWPDRPFEPSSWEWFFEAYDQPPEQGIATMQEAIAERGERGELLYHLACMELRAGRTDDALAHLRRAVELRPDTAAQARDDEDFTPLHGDPRYEAIVNPGGATDTA
jgi:mannose-6-phosphate isomerase-like protein (cupin superfamily)